MSIPMEMHDSALTRKVFGTVACAACALALAAAPGDDCEISSSVCFAKDGEAGMFFRMDDAAGTGLYLWFDSRRDAIGVRELPLDKSRTKPWLKPDYVAYRSVPIATNVWYDFRVWMNAEFIRIWFNDNPLDANPYPKFDLDIARSYPGRQIALRRGKNGVAKFRKPVVKPSSPLVEDSGTYRNPVLPSVSDPYVISSRGMYYLYGNNVGDSRFFYAYKSSDLVRWERSAKPIISAGLAFGERNFRSPRVLEKDGLYYLFYNAKQGGVYKQAVAVSESPFGPFRNDGKPLAMSRDDAIRIGARPVVDPATGKTYLVAIRCRKGNHIVLYECSIGNGRVEVDVDSERMLLSPEADWERNGGRVVEGGDIFFHNGYYYLIYAGGNYNTAYGEGYAVSRDIKGPYERAKTNPVLFSTRSAWGNGDASIVWSEDGSEGVIVYFRHTSRQSVRPLNVCVDRCKFVPDSAGGADRLEISGPTVSPQPRFALVSTAGNE